MNAEMNDTMPAETATNLLFGNLTNTMRKRCMAARCHFVEAPAIARKSTEEKLAGKLKGKPLASLGKWLRRAIARRITVQRAWTNTKNDLQMPAPIRASLAAVLEEKANNLDLMRDACEDELKGRTA